MPRIGSTAGRSLANTASKRIFGNFPFSFTNITSSATRSQLGGTTTRTVDIANIYSLSGVSLSYSVTGLPYHSYGNPSAANTPAATNLIGTWTWRGGTNVAATPKVAVGNGLIGLWLNGVAMFNYSAASGTPSGYTSPGASWNYNASFENGEDYGYSFGEDIAGGHAAPPNQYHYHDGSFFKSWISGVGNTPGLTVGSTGLAESSLIPYLQSGLFHADGHSKILGISKDGYPVYGPYGYANPTNALSGIKRMISGYGLKKSNTRTGAAANLVTYPMGLFTQDYAYTGTESLKQTYNLTADTFTSLFLSRVWKTGGVDYTENLGTNPPVSSTLGSTITFNVNSSGHAIYLKTRATQGTADQVNTGYITGQGTESGALVWNTEGAAPGNYYYVCANHGTQYGSITLNTAALSDLDQYNGRYCYTPDYPSGTYAYFTTIDSDGGPVFPYVIGPSYYGSPAA
jgi:hypothetical protein